MIEDLNIEAVNERRIETFTDENKNVDEVK